MLRKYLLLLSPCSSQLTRALVARYLDFSESSLSRLTLHILISTSISFNSIQYLFFHDIRFVLGDHVAPLVSGL